MATRDATAAVDVDDAAPCDDDVDALTWVESARRPIVRAIVVMALGRAWLRKMVAASMVNTINNSSDR